MKKITFDEKSLRLNDQQQQQHHQQATAVGMGIKVATPTSNYHHNLAMTPSRMENLPSLPITPSRADNPMLIENSTMQLKRRLERLSDVTFLVGPDKLPVKANKTTLSIRSEVFDKMFFGDFPLTTDIPIEDINEADFVEMLGFIYLNKVNLKTSNVHELIYAAEKYRLPELKMECEKYLVACVTKENVLRIFRDCQTFHCPMVDNKCFEILLDNPIKFFVDPHFMNMTANGLRKIIQQPRINCTEQQLKDVSLKWLKSHNYIFPEHKEFNEDAYAMLEKVIGVTRYDYENKQFYKTEIDRFERFSIEVFSENQTMVRKLTKPLQGIGVYVGVSSERDEAETCIDSKYFSESLLVKFEYPEETKNLRQSWRLGLTVERKITQSTTKGILDVMFEKLPPSKDRVRITIDFGGECERDFHQINVFTCAIRSSFF
jgi:BTB/POZ domain